MDAGDTEFNNFEAEVIRTFQLRRSNMLNAGKAWFAAAIVLSATAAYLFNPESYNRLQTLLLIVDILASTYCT